MKLHISVVAILVLTTLASFTISGQQQPHSIVGRWKLVDMQFGSGSGGKPKRADKSISQNKTRFVFEESGQFTMELGPNGRGLRGGYFYDTVSQVLSIKYGAYTDTAFVSWESADRMIHSTKDGQTRTTMERVTE